MAKNEFILPPMGEGIIEATVTRWFVKEGDEISEDDPLLEVATDKVDSEVPAPFTGRISRIIYHEGEIPKIGEVLAIIETEGPEEEHAPEIGATAQTAQNTTHLKESVPKSGQNKKPPVKYSGPASKEKPITPYVRFLAQNRGISSDELKMIRGTGLNNRLTKDDINKYILEGRPFKSAYFQEQDKGHENNNTENNTNQPSYSPEPGEELIEMSRTRRLIAEHMVRSKRISPHVTSMVELDITPVVQWRENNKTSFMEKHGIKLTYTPLIVEAATKALKDYPDINISVTGNYIIKKSNFNIGVATALPDGNLIVPVIKEADKRSFVNIASTLTDLAKRAREGALNPAEIKGGTFTITNMGQYDNISGTPIINQPEVAILAVGAIKKKPAVVNIGGKEAIGIRDILILSLTYDHRVVDGALGGSFVKRIGEYLTKEFPDF